MEWSGRYRRWALAAATVAMVAWIALSLMTAAGIRTFGYESSDGHFTETEVPSKGRTFDSMLARFEAHKEFYGRPSLQLFRTTKRSNWNLFHWWDNFTHPRWDIPYRPPLDNPPFDSAHLGQLLGGTEMDLPPPGIRDDDPPPDVEEADPSVSPELEEWLDP